MSDLSSRGSRRALAILGPLTFLAMTAALACVFFAARRAAPSMGGDLQRIFYFHVPAAWCAYLAFAIVFVCSIAYLRTGARRWDLLAHSSAEVGVLFCTLVLVTGPIWAHPVWGTWWQWDARLTSTLLLWLSYAGYLLLRGLSSDPARTGRLAAVLGIAGFLNVPVVHFSVYWWRTLHPQGPTVANPTQASGLGPGELLAFFSSLLAFTLLLAWLLTLRTRLGRLGDRVEAMEIAAQRRAEGAAPA
jgi:heme exporter protein C